MQMRITFQFLAIVALVVGCTQSRVSQPVTVDSTRLSEPRSVTAVTNALEKSPTFLELKRCAERPMVVIDEEEKGWVTVEIGNLSGKLFHRWATLKVEESSGAILKLGTDVNLEDKWVVEFQPKK